MYPIITSRDAYNTLPNDTMQQETGFAGHARIDIDFFPVWQDLHQMDDHYTGSNFQFRQRLSSAPARRFFAISRFWHVWTLSKSDIIYHDVASGYSFMNFLYARNVATRRFSSPRTLSKQKWTVNRSLYLRKFLSTSRWESWFENGTCTRVTCTWRL